MNDQVGDTNLFSADSQQRIKVAKKADGLKHQYADEDALEVLRGKVWFMNTYVL